MKKIAMYQLIRQCDDEVLFSAMRIKHYPAQGYLVMLEQYPAATTKALVCRKTSDEKNPRVCRITGAGEGCQGNWLVVCQRQSEVDAEKAIEKNIRGSIALQAALGG